MGLEGLLKKEVNHLVTLSFKYGQVSFIISLFLNLRHE
jgi:hypothetical protein